MNIDIDIKHNALDSARFDIGLSSRYLPIELTATSFGGIGECIAFLANDADGQFTNISVDKDSVLFIILWNQNTYDEIKKDVLKMDYWVPFYNFHRVSGEVNGITRTIYLDSRAYRKIVRPQTQPHIRTISKFSSYDVLFPYIAYVSEDFKPIFSASPIFKSSEGFDLKNNSISAKVDPELLKYYSYKNDCDLKSFNKYYDRYVVTNMLGMQYLIYSEEGFSLLRQYFYDTSDHATKEILSDKVVGAITILQTPAFERKINAITIFLTKEPIKVERASNVDMKSTTYEGYPIKPLQSQSTKVLTLSIIHSILKKYNYQVDSKLMINYDILGGWNDFFLDCEKKGILSDFSSFFLMDKTQAKKRYESMLYDLRHKKDEYERFESYINSNFDTMNAADRELCAFLFPKFKGVK